MSILSFFGHLYIAFQYLRQHYDVPKNAFLRLKLNGNPHKIQNKYQLWFKCFVKSQFLSSFLMILDVIVCTRDTLFELIGLSNPIRYLYLILLKFFFQFRKFYQRSKICGQKYKIFYSFSRYFEKSDLWPFSDFCLVFGPESFFFSTFFNVFLASGIYMGANKM